MRKKKKLSGTDLVEKNIRTYHSLLTTSGNLHLRSLEDAHLEMESSLHPYGESEQVDITAFVYAAIRLPECMDAVKRVILAQSEEVFEESGIKDLFHMKVVATRARRREVRFDGKQTLAMFVSSVSDIDDLIPSLIAFQLEWNKMHKRLEDSGLGDDLAEGKVRAGQVPTELKQALGLRQADWEFLLQVWGEGWDDKIEAIALAPKNIQVSMARGGFTEYRRSVQNWWNEIMRLHEKNLFEFRPVYFVSSNMHSMANLVSGFAAENRQAIEKIASEGDFPELSKTWRRLERQDDEYGKRDLIYFAMRHYLAADPARNSALKDKEQAAGIWRYEDPHILDRPAQIIDLRKMDPQRLDSRLQTPDLGLLQQSRALILNIDYPLGFAAYHIFSQILASVKQLRGVYFLGKAAIMNGRLGDIMIPREVYDLHSRNRFFFSNCFSAKDLMDLVQNVAVFDQQKSLCVRGTFLQNKEMMQSFHLEDFNGIEMEAGPYLCAVYENLFPERYPMQSTVNLHDAHKYDLGMLHYASDTPYSRRESLLGRNLDFTEAEPIYACTIAILRKIVLNEIRRIKAGEG